LQSKGTDDLNNFYFSIVFFSLAAVLAIFVDLLTIYRQGEYLQMRFENGWPEI